MKRLDQRSFFKSTLALILATTFSCVGIVPVSLAQATDDTIELIAGDLETIPVHNLTRVSVTDPNVADISDAQSDKVLILGKKSGQTIVFLWDDGGKRTIYVRVVTEDLNIVKKRIQTVLEKSDVKNISLDVNQNEGKVVVSGSLTKAEKVQLDKLLEAYSDNILNLTKEENTEDLVQVDLQVTELSTSLDKNVGIDWKNNSSVDTDKPLGADYIEQVPADLAAKGSQDWFKLGSFSRNTQIMATVNALVKEGKGRVLSKPRLVVVSGKEASFLVGGEIPIRTTTTSASGGSTENSVSFKQYGVNMTITPTVRNGKVDILLNVQISDVDRAKQSVDGDVSFVTRQAQTQLYLDNGQTIVLAGLIKHTDGETVKKVPILGSIPIIGMAFRNRSTPTANGDTELVISLTPRILRDKAYAEKEHILPSPENRAFQAEVDSKYESKKLTYPEKKAAASPTPVLVNTPSTPTKTVSVSSGNTAIPYARSIQEKISQGITYPYEALQNNWQGTVKLKLHILKDGTLANATILESSGHDVFDKDALNTAKIVAPYAPFTQDMSDDDLVVTVPIVYSQGAISK